MDENGVNKIVHDAPRKICGVGYVILSRAQDPDSYISSSFRNNRISIITDQSEIISGCIVSKNAWQYLEFPATIKERGSCVVWVNVPYQNRVIILDVLNKRDELNPIQNPGQFKFQRRVGENVVTVQGDGNTGVINIIANGNASDEGEMYLKVLNQNELAVFNLYVQGMATVDVEKDLNFRVGNSINTTVRNEANPNTEAIFNYILGTGYTFLDEFNNSFKTTTDGIFNEVPNGKKVYARESGTTSEPGLLGDKTTTLFNDIINLLNDMVTVLQGAADGTYVTAPPVLTAAANWIQSIVTINSDLEVIEAQNFELS